MSALGQKRTFAVQNGMSALPPIADMCSALAYVRFVPIADIQDFVLTKRKTPGRYSGAFTLAIHGLLRCIRTHEFTAAWASAADLDQRRLPYFYIVSDVRRLGIEASRG